MSDSTDLLLTDADRNSSLWLRMAEHLEVRLYQLRRKNDNHLPVEQTAALRGSIAELKKLLAAGTRQD